MSDDTFKLRVVVVREPGDNWPWVGASIAEDSWVNLPPEDWDGIKRKMLDDQVGPDWMFYETTEAVLHIPYDKLRGLFAPPIEVDVEKA